MKTYKEYLAESKRTFEFRVKIADCDITPELREKIEQALEAYKLSDISKPKRLPIERTKEFSQLGPVERQQFDIKVEYPTVPDAVRQTIHACCGIPLVCIRVVNLFADEQEHDPVSNHEEGAVLANELPADDGKAQDTVGDRKVGSLLKELEKTKHGGDQHKGINDDILAAAVHKETAAKFNSDSAENKTSVLGTHKTKLPAPQGR